MNQTALHKKLLAVMKAVDAVEKRGKNEKQNTPMSRLQMSPRSTKGSH